MSAQAERSPDLTIGQVARKFKLTLQTLHFYEDEGLIQPYRIAGKRLYDKSSVRRLAFILEKKNLGHSLAKIAVLLTECELLVLLTRIGNDYLQPRWETLS